MNVCVVLKFLGVLTLVICAWMLLPFAYALWAGGGGVSSFAGALVIGLAVAMALYAAGWRADMSGMRIREAMACVTFSWIVASAVGGMPYWLEGSAPTYTDAFFEGMSGFTTTGATILSNPEHTPKTLLLWRGVTHWLGGMGIIALTLIVLPLTGIGGFQLYLAEAPGISSERVTPRARQTAVILWTIYVGLTGILTGLLVLCGMTAFDALMHAMGTISTGGFSPHNASMAFYDKPQIDWIVGFFMFASGANFVLHFHAMKRRSLRVFFLDPEFRFYTRLVVALSLLVAAGLYFFGVYDDVASALRYGTFHVISLVTTTGFVGADYEVWPPFCKALLFFCLFVGGCSGSTSGGMKVSRLMVLGQVARRHFIRLLNPRAVLPIKIGDAAAGGAVVSSTLAFFGLYVFVFAVGIFAVALYEPDLFTAISGVAATLGNVGPGFGSLGADGNFLDQATAAKWIYAFLMLCGRLELFTVLLLFSRAFWSEGVSFASCRGK